MRTESLLVVAVCVALGCAEEGDSSSDEPLTPTDSPAPGEPGAASGDPTGPGPSGGGGVPVAPNDTGPDTPGGEAGNPASGSGGTPATPTSSNPGGAGSPQQTAGGPSSGGGGSGGAPPAGGTGGTSSAGASGQPAGTGGTTVDGDAFTVEVQLASEVDPNAPGTVGIVTWSTTLGTPTEAGIEFGLDTEYGMTAPVDLGATDYRTLLLGMKPDREYHFRVLALVDGASYASEDYTVETGPPTTLVELGSFDVVDDGTRERGFIVTSYWQGSGGHVPFIIDQDGEIVWWYESETNGIARARMSADGKNMWITPASNNGGPLERVTMDGLDGETYPGAIGSHDLTPVSGELMAFIEYGESDCDSVFEIDPSGETREVIETEGVIMATGGGAFGCHANALRYSAAEDVYTVSDVSTDVLVFDREGVLQWRLSDIVAGGVETWGGSQHGHHLLANSMLVYANRYGGANASAAVEYTLDGELIFHYESGDFSANLGDAQRLPGGNTLVTFSNDSLIHEVDAEGNLVLEIDGGGDAMGYALWRETLYGPPPDLHD